MAENEYQDCPWCGGCGYEPLFTVRGIANSKCIPCDGSGKMTPAQMEEWDERSKFGRNVAMCRIKQTLSTREFSMRLGMNPMRLNEIEHAKGEPVTDSEKELLRPLLEVVEG